MADFTRMSAAEADTELREMRQALLKKLAAHEAAGETAPATQRRIHALNRALQSLTAEHPAQGVLLTVPPTAKAPQNPPRGGSYRDR